MKKNSLEISALDTLFFKDGKPFSMGEESWASGIFPPYPSAVYGMLRSVWFADNLEKLPFANQPGNDPTLGLQLSGYLMAINGRPAFPIPADLYGTGTKGTAQRFKIGKLPEGACSEYALPQILCANSQGKYEELHGKALLMENTFVDYLAAQQDRYPYAPIADLITEEPKIGIGKDRVTRTSADGQLYRLSMRRLSSKDANGKTNSLSFLLGYSGIDLPAEGLTRFGAETRSATYKSCDFPDVQCPVTEGIREFKIYLATPAVFQEGSWPRTWFNEHGLELLAAAIGKPEHIGGFDIQAGRPKPMYKAVPAGTVYYVRALPTADMTTLLKLHGRSIYDLAPQGDRNASHYGPQGFGHTYLGLIHA